MRVKRLVLKTERSDYGKAVRRAYERGEVSLRRIEVKQYTIRLDGVSNTITSVQKDNWILCTTI
jgi:DNA (cytosine-5)-methyltransferase 3A